MRAEKRQRVTLAMIAQEVGVSVGAVSLVLNNHAKSRTFRSEIVERIRATANRLGYRSSSAARNIARTHSGLVGLILPNMMGNLGVNWPDYLVYGMRQVLDPLDYLMFVATHRMDPDLEQREIDRMVEAKADAIVCPPTVDSIGKYREVIEKGVPLLLVEDRVDGLPEASYVMWDGYRASRIAVEHLVSIGRKKIAFLGREHLRADGGRHRPFKHVYRHQGYDTALREAGLSVVDDWSIWPAFKPEKSVIGQHVATLFSGPASERPDALVTSSNLLGAHAYWALQDMGLRVPEDVAVVTLGGHPSVDDLGLRLTSVQMSSWKLGRVVGETLLQVFNDPEAEPVGKIVSECLLKVRRSTVREAQSGDETTELFPPERLIASM